MKQERRGFLRSFGLLSLAAAIPKFLFGKHDINVKEDKMIIWSDSSYGRLPFKNHKECIDKNDLKVGHTGDIREKSTDRYFMAVDLGVLPEKMNFNDWYYFLKNDKILYYSPRNIDKIRPKEMQKSCVANTSSYFRIIDKGFDHYTENKEIFQLLQNITVIDFDSNWHITANGWCNYMSIQNYPNGITGGETIC